ncbi:ABC transporter permease [Mesorhizobium escarrei]|uniref:ABC transporter permease n=2 Tax=Mesorhizobium escarrei TaxID=666018 RepID=A0ABN8KFR6_9HYPH|nr:ABC transporter permease [Mesorhizobium escarrei]
MPGCGCEAASPTALHGLAVFMQTTLSIATDAFAYGMVLFIISIGLSLTMGLMRVVNLAHGAFAMIGGYIASYITRDLGWGYVPAILLGVAGTIIIAAPFERLLFRRIYGKPELLQVLMTIGITFCVIGVTNYFFGPTLKTIPLPDILTRPVDIGFRTIAAHRLFVMACGVGVAAALWFLIEKTGFGIKLRAAVDNAAMTDALGVRTPVVYAIAFAVAVGLAAFGGIIGAEFLPVEPYYALRYMVLFLVVVSVGGAGSILGTLVACLALGAVDTVGRYLMPDFGNFFFYAAVIAIVFAFPRGFFGRAQ